MPQTAPIHRRIGLLGGSFNPPHAGHRAISVAALERLGLDAVWWMVTPGNPLKDPDIYQPFERRVQLARKAANHPDIVVSDFEHRHHLQYTVDTLERLKSLYPDTAFVWLMGADGLENFHRWKDWRRIANLVPFAVFNRPGYEEKALSGEAAKELSIFRIEEKAAENLAGMEPPAWVFFPDTDISLSSTAIRNASPKTKEV